MTNKDRIRYMRGILKALGNGETNFKEMISYIEKQPKQWMMVTWAMTVLRQLHRIKLAKITKSRTADYRDIKARLTFKGIWMLHVCDHYGMDAASYQKKQRIG